MDMHATPCEIVLQKALIRKMPWSVQVSVWGRRRLGSCLARAGKGTSRPATCHHARGSRP